MASFLPTINAILNFVSAVLLIMGYFAIKKGNREQHQKFMSLALISSALFLSCYLVYHYQVGSVAYPRHDWTRPLYFLILIPHVILAMIMTPFIALLVKHAVKKDFVRHKKLAKWVFPVWVYVSITGVLVYLMLYVF